jgi:hypothetical protein
MSARCIFAYEAQREAHLILANSSIQAVGGVSALVNSGASLAQSDDVLF